jgi:hypothetical protein
MAPQATKQGGLLPPKHHRIGSCRCKGLNSEKVPCAIFMLAGMQNPLAMLGKPALLGRLLTPYFD